MGGAAVDKRGEFRYHAAVQSDTFPSALPGVQPCGENRKPGENPGRDRRCKRGSALPEAKAGHWETEKAMETQDKIHKRESEDLRGL